MNAPVMLAPILRTPAGEGPEITAEEAVEVIRAAAANAKLVMPPLVARFFEQKLNEVADTTEGGGNIAWLVLNSWLDQIDEINAYAARARQHTEHEVFIHGTTPEDATYSASADTLDDALAAETWLAGAGAAHRTAIRLYGPWEIDKPAKQTKESAA